ncbi:ricin-type beta-trefoil lectin domain protein, partial [Streptomyces sp. NPDC050263]|uniref:RICIN domain-containing protein n=1 Tax=Streptomyces sp. NPDC050263 TaxID=3155037 RepID=UPI003430FEC8
REAEAADGRLRSPDTGLCLDVPGGRAEAGAPIVLAPCSQATSQRWSYLDDGLLRSVADPTLCLTADPGRRTAALGRCLVHSGETFFDLTVRGELLLRRDGNLVVARGAGGSGKAVVVTERDGSVGQRWVFDTAVAAAGEPGPEARKATEPPGSGASDAPGSQGSPDGQAPPIPGPIPRSAPPLAPDDVPGAAEPAPSAPEFRTRVAQVGCCDTAPDPAGTPEAPHVSAALTEVVGGVIESLGHRAAGPQ